MVMHEESSLAASGGPLLTGVSVCTTLATFILASGSSENKMDQRSLYVHLVGPPTHTESIQP